MPEFTDAEFDGTAGDAQPLDAYEVISEIRDRYPRNPGDVPTGEIVAALMEAGLLAQESGSQPVLIAELPVIGYRGYRLDREYRVNQRAIRIAVSRRSSAAGSVAATDVFHASLTWGALADTPASLWWEGTPDSVATGEEVVAALGPVADGLLERAVAILAGVPR